MHQITIELIEKHYNKKRKNRKMKKDKCAKCRYEIAKRKRKGQEKGQEKTKKA